MKNRIFTVTAVAVFSAVVIFLIYDTVVSYSEISRNSEIIEALERDSKKIEEEIIETRLKVERFKKDPKAAEAILRKKFEMLRTDQYFINDKTN
jgi:cell division protein FtsB